MHSEFLLPNGAIIVLFDDFPEFQNGNSRLLPKNCASPVAVHLQFQNDKAAKQFCQRIKNNEKEGFNILMEYGKQFWNENYGKFDDKYGHSWSIGSPLSGDEVNNNNNNHETIKINEEHETKNETGFYGLKRFGNQYGLSIEFIINNESGYDFGKASKEGFKTLNDYCTEHSLNDKIDKCISISPDDPNVVHNCRYMPTLIFKSDQISLEDLKKYQTEKIKVKEFDDVNWYVYQLVGSCDLLPQAWPNALQDVKQKNLTLLGKDYFFEWYVNDFRSLPTEEWITWICLGVADQN